MVDWKCKTSIVDLLAPEPSPENARKAARGIIERLNRDVPTRLREEWFEDIIDGLEETAASENSVPLLKHSLGELYDWADYGHRLWLAPSPAGLAWWQR